MIGKSRSELGWPLVTLGAICTVGGGNSAPQGDVYFANGNYQFVRTQDVGRSETPYLQTTVDRINDLAVEHFRLRLWPARSLLVPKSGASVALNHRSLLQEPSYVASHLAVLSPGPLVDPEYLYFVFCAMDMMKLALDPAYPSFRTSDLAKLRIALPPLSEQRRIANILLEAAKVKQLCTEADTKTAKLVSEIFSEIFLEDPDRKTWPVITLGDAAADNKGSIRTGPFGSDLLHSEFVSEGVPVLGIDNVVENRFSWKERRYIPLDRYQEFSRFTVFPGDVLVTIMGTVGRTCVAPLNLPTSISTKHLCVITLNQEKLLPAYVSAALLYDPEVRRQTLAVGSGAIMEGWNSRIIKALRLRHPPLSLQNSFTKRVHEVDAVLDLAETSRTALEFLTDSLSAIAFSGDLTADWRRMHRHKLESEGSSRDQAIKETSINSPMAKLRTVSEITVTISNKGANAELNRELQDLLINIQDSGSGHNAHYFSAESLSESAGGSLRRNSHAIEGHLAVLAARGLIIPVSREQQTEDTGEFVFGNAYRLPLADYRPTEEEASDQIVGDYARIREIERLAARLQKGAE